MSLKRTADEELTEKPAKKVADASRQGYYSRKFAKACEEGLKDPMKGPDLTTYIGAMMEEPNRGEAKLSRNWAKFAEKNKLYAFLLRRSAKHFVVKNAKNDERLFHTDLEEGSTPKRQHFMFIQEPTAEEVFEEYELRENNEDGSTPKRQHFMFIHKPTAKEVFEEYELREEEEKRELEKKRAAKAAESDDEDGASENGKDDGEDNGENADQPRKVTKDVEKSSLGEPPSTSQMKVPQTVPAASTPTKSRTEMAQYSPSSSYEVTPKIREEMHQLRKKLYNRRR